MRVGDVGRGDLHLGEYAGEKDEGIGRLEVLEEGEGMSGHAQLERSDLFKILRVQYPP